MAAKHLILSRLYERLLQIKLRLKCLAHKRASCRPQVSAVKSMATEPAPRSGFLPLDLMLRPFRAAISKNLCYPHKISMDSYLSQCLPSTSSVSFQMFLYTPWDIWCAVSMATFTGEVFFSNCKTCVTQDFQSFSRTVHLRDEAVIASEQYTLWVWYSCEYQFPSRSFSPNIYLWIRKLLHDYKKLTSWSGR